MVVVLTLMPNGQDRDCLIIIDLKQSDVSCCTKGDNDFTQKRIVVRRLPAAEWECAQKRHALRDRSARLSRGFYILLNQEFKLAQ